MTKKELIAKDDRRVLCICKFKGDGGCCKTINAFPYTAIRISFEQYEAIKKITNLG